MRGGTATDGTLGALSDKGVPALVSATDGYVGAGSTLVRFNPAALGATVSTVETLATDAIRTSPVLGAARPVGGSAEGYAVSQAGTLVVFSQSTGAKLWDASLVPAGDQVLTHMTMDCNRVTSNKTTGVLYVGAKSGVVQALIVDAPRLLDSVGAWPKYQRSAGNAGNDDVTNFKTNWPGCP
jgi:hypothetical protein